MHFEQSHEPNRRRGYQRLDRRLLIVLVTALAVVVASLVLSAYMFVQLKQEKVKPAQSAQQETDTERVVRKVGKIYELPEEDATLARVNDREKLGDQPFFAPAQKGDYILVFPKAKIAIIYRESSNKLINVGPVSVDKEQQASPSPQR